MASHLIDYSCGCYVLVPDDPIDGIIYDVHLLFCSEHKIIVGASGAAFKKDIL
jgi:hypothetical protein